MGGSSSSIRPLRRESESRARVVHMHIYSVIDPGSIRGGQVVVDSVELDIGKEVRRVLKGLFIGQPSEGTISSSLRFVLCAYRRESVVRFATGIDSPGLRSARNAQ